MFISTDDDYSIESVAISPFPSWSPKSLENPSKSPSTILVSQAQITPSTLDLIWRFWQFRIILICQEWVEEWGRRDKRIFWVLNGI